MLYEMPMIELSKLNSSLGRVLLNNLYEKKIGIVNERKINMPLIIQKDGSFNNSFIGFS